ncbi:hypothetical protein V8D89_009866 [Ganoderma adspersum]
MTWWYPISLLATLFLTALSAVQPSQAGNTTCVSRQLDWYTSVVGESPCMTYQRLRQICNNDYQVPRFAAAVPGDHCDDQLSMLCLVCQQDHQDTSGSGIDAAKNRTLPDNLQRAVCNNNIRLDDFLYGGWDDGSCVYTKENAELSHAANNNNTFTHCPNQTSASSSLSSASSTHKFSSPRPSSTGEAGGTVAAATSTKPVSRGALIGGVVGGVLGLTVIVLAVIVWIRIRRRTRSKGSEWSQNPRFGFMYSSTQASGGAPKGSLAESKFSMGGSLSSGFSYHDPDISIAGSCVTSTGTPGWSNAVTGPPSSPAYVEPSARPDGKASLDRPLRSNSRSFSEVYGTGSSEGSEYSTTRTQSHSGGTRASVSLSTFDFAGSQVPDDGQTTRSFPLSVNTNGNTTHHSPSRNYSRPPGYGRNTGVPESRDRSHHS